MIFALKLEKSSQLNRLLELTGEYFGDFLNIYQYLKNFN